MFLAWVGVAFAGGCNAQGADSDPAKAAALAACLDSFDLRQLALVALEEAATASGDAGKQAIDALSDHALEDLDLAPIRRAVAAGAVGDETALLLTAAAPFDAAPADPRTHPTGSLAGLLAEARAAYEFNVARKYKSEVLADREIMRTDPGPSPPARLAAVEGLKDRALLDVAQIYFEIGRYQNAGSYAALTVANDGSSWLGIDQLAVAEANLGTAPVAPVPGPSSKGVLPEKGWERRTLDPDAGFAPATQLALAVRAVHAGDTNTTPKEHLDRFAAELADIDGAVALAHGETHGWALWTALSPSLRSDLRQREAIAGPVARRHGIEDDLSRAKKRGVEAWADAAATAEYARIDADLDAELPAALDRRAAFAHGLAEAAAALGRGETPAIAVTSFGSIADYGSWPGTPRRVPAEGPPATEATPGPP